MLGSTFSLSTRPSFRSDIFTEEYNMMMIHEAFRGIFFPTNIRRGVWVNSSRFFSWIHVTVTKGRTMWTCLAHLQRLDDDQEQQLMSIHPFLAFFSIPSSSHRKTQSWFKMRSPPVDDDLAFFLFVCLILSDDHEWRSLFFFFPSPHHDSHL